MSTAIAKNLMADMKLLGMFDAFDDALASATLEFTLRPAFDRICARSSKSIHAIECCSSPMSSIVIRTLSPDLRKTPLPAPTPAGVPVRIMSPG